MSYSLTSALFSFNFFAYNNLAFVFILHSPHLAACGVSVLSLSSVCVLVDGSQFGDGLRCLFLLLPLMFLHCLRCLRHSASRANEPLQTVKKSEHCQPHPSPQSTTTNASTSFLLLLLHLAAYHPKLCSSPCRDWLWWCHHCSYLLQPNCLMKTEWPTILATHWEQKKTEKEQKWMRSRQCRGEERKKEIWVTTADDRRWHTAFSLQLRWVVVFFSLLNRNDNLCAEMHPFNGTCLVCGCCC